MYRRPLSTHNNIITKCVFNFIGRICGSKYDNKPVIMMDSLVQHTISPPLQDISLLSDTPMMVASPLVSDKLESSSPKTKYKFSIFYVYKI